MKKQPIGIFDSGVGGLTVFKEIRCQFPWENIVYFGDTARVPYGPKSRGTVIEYSIQNARFLIQCGAKLIVVACNTSSSVALETLSQNISVPVLGVINPGAETAVKTTRNGKIGIIGTEGTIRSNAYTDAISKLDKNVQVFSTACPLFVSLAEEGWEDHPVTKLVIEEYLTPLLKKEIDTLVLGCTHYPILKKAIQNFVGNDIKLVDSAQAVTEELKSILDESETSPTGNDEFYVSDNEDKFHKIATRILDKNVESLLKVKLGESWYI
ncbi:MAG: glutamate racemase [Candidatus Cloacimonetes bacterium]|nr:glutamate racemase [Candidatus Cloacimonadota bacterium]MCF7814492.1 glutamate racemase [Candidatus Cloacimonadota bacterium]MCF7867884.1 glutamate racemase [Candidatus Cloacimonadota bacterium]MCF7883703.1 glutamate racemase [Candidatus Cloacimonadota bacterium]